MQKKKSGYGLLIFLLLIAVVAGLAYWYFGIYKPAHTPEPTSTSAPVEMITVVLNVRMKDGRHAQYPVEIEEGATLKDAMIKAGILHEEDIKDGMIMTVCGETADYETDRAYWTLRENTMPLMEGAETAKLKNYAQYDIFYTVWDGN